MSFKLQSDYPVTDEACKKATGKTLEEWAEAIKANPEIANKRRDALVWIMGDSRTAEAVWWATTIWVEYERRLGRVQKDGRPEGYNICCTKSIAAPVEQIQKSLEKEFKNITRVRDGKDIRATWRSDGVDTDTDVDVAMVPTGNKIGITLTHKRIGSRDEADGLRSYWSGRLAELKTELES